MTTTIIDNLTLYNGDCMDYLRTLPNNAFDLAIVDPPYGIGADWKKRNKGCVFAQTSYDNKEIPTKEYFQELERVSKDRIIFGYNYYTEFLGSTNYLIVWDKCSNNNQVFMYSKCEIAYTTKRVPCNLVSIPWDGYRMGAETGRKKIHPHQKPIALYAWILNNYANSGDRILDTHLGSGSSAIAAWELGFEFVGIEIDKEYYNNAVERIKRHTAQGKLF
ncbi:MAG: site-specific DNA-methyltransferase [Bacteroidales bacterium]|nr:site-specific DNA-methyltransferase [Bacteroidales bacterium]